MCHVMVGGSLPFTRSSSEGASDGLRGHLCALSCSRVVWLLLPQSGKAADSQQNITMLWNITGTHLANERKSFGSTSYAQVRLFVMLNDVS